MSEEEARILVVDDEDSILHLVEEMLAPEGYEVLLAHGGQEALEKIEEACPDLVLLDIRMPGMSGLKVLHTVRQSLQIPVIMLTGVRAVNWERDSLELGADDYLSKPFSKGELLARIKAKLRRAAWDKQRDSHKDHSQNT